MTGEHPAPVVLDRYLDGALAPAEQAALAAHLAGCAACRAELAALCEVWTVLAALPPERLPVDLAPVVLARLTPPTSRWQVAALGVALAAQAAAALLLAGWLARLLPTRLPAWAVDVTWLPSADALPALALPRVPLPANGLLFVALAVAAGIWLAGNGVLLRARIPANRAPAAGAREEAV